MCLMHVCATRLIVPCDTLQHTATHYNTLQHTARHYNTLQHTATHCNTAHEGKATRYGPSRRDLAVHGTMSRVANTCICHVSNESCLYKRAMSQMSHVSTNESCLKWVMSLQMSHIATSCTRRHLSCCACGWATTRVWTSYVTCMRVVNETCQVRMNAFFFPPWNKSARSSLYCVHQLYNWPLLHMSQVSRRCD